MPKKKNLKAALKKKQKKKQQAKKQAKNQQPAKKNKSKNQSNNSNDVLNQIIDPNAIVKEFIRDINIHNYSLAPIGGGPNLIQRSEIKLTHGHRYGLIGYNGTGKTTFLKDISSGRYKEIPKYLRIRCVQQEMGGSDLSVMQTVLKSDKERDLLLLEQKRLTEKLAELHILDEQQKANKKKNLNNNNNDNTIINNNGTTDDNKININNDSPVTNGDTPVTNGQITDTNTTTPTTTTTTSTTTTAVDNTSSPIPDDANDKSDNTLIKNGNNVKNKKKKKKKNQIADVNIDELGIKYTNDLQKVIDRLKFIDADTAEARASAVLNGLGFTDRMKNMKTCDLSGGWRMRVSLACALFICPDILLLDEPTNHLDFPSVIWLSDYLAYEYPDTKTIIIVSHDRRFLNDVCTDIIHLENCRLRYYSGNYDQFLKIRSEMRTHQRKQYERQQKMIKHNQDFIAKFKANKKWSTQAQSRQKLLSRVNKIQKVLSDLEFRFTFPKPDKPKNDLLFHFDDVVFGYFGELKGKNISSYLLYKINLRVKFGQKIGVIGANGSGKSTLIKLIMQEVHPITGTAHLANSCQVGYFGQHHLDTLNYNATPLEHLKKVFGSGTTQQQIYAQLGRFNLGDKFARRKIGTLSGGQKSRVAFSILTWYSPHIIIMDEPTNHLDMPTIDALAIALSNYDGCILIVSHDQHFVETCCDEFWCVGQRKIKQFDNFDKCREFSKKCKAPNVLPRKFSTINVKRTINLNINDNNIDNIKYKTKNTKDELKTNNNASNIFEIDPEREVDKGLEKGLTPNAILRHIRGWKPHDGNFGIVTKLGFIMFHDYFDDKKIEYSAMDHNEFFKLWKNIINYCIPLTFRKNQLQLIEIGMRNFSTAKKDNPTSKRVNGSYSFGLILESMVRQNEMISIDFLKEFLLNKKIEKNYNKLNNIQKDVLQEITTFITIFEEDSDSDSDSDSD